jgi:NAD(P)H dehydrogenase (quinone)
MAFTRPAWFLDNAAWDVASARESGTLQSFLMPTTRPFPMVAARDVGRVAARLTREMWTGTRIVELEGPARVSANDLAGAFASALGKPVRAVPVPRETWPALFRAQGMKNPEPRIRMLEGFNEGWIDFAAGRTHSAERDDYRPRRGRRARRRVALTRAACLHCGVQMEGLACTRSRSARSSSSV